MKKILLGLAFGLGVFASAQQYPNNGWRDDGYYQNGDGYYSDEDDRNYFPDDYYYNYPQDYYPGDYYQSYYNDYRNSIINIDWNGFFVQNRLNRWQVDQIMRLNNLYASFTAWDNFYRYNPDRWYYDRFSCCLCSILCFISAALACLSCGVVCCAMAKPPIPINAIVKTNFFIF